MNLWAFIKQTPKLHHTCKLDTLIFSQLQSAFFVLSQMWSMYLFLWSFSHFRVVHRLLSLPLSSVQTCWGILSPSLHSEISQIPKLTCKAKDNLDTLSQVPQSCRDTVCPDYTAFSYILYNYRKQTSGISSPCNPEA